MNTNTFVITDLETTSISTERTQIIQIAAIAVDPRKLEIIPDTEFETLVRPEFDEEKCKELNLDPLTQSSINVHGKTHEMLKDAPTIRGAWDQYVKYVRQFGTGWSAPILSGYNVINFDYPILKRYAEQAPFNLGPVTAKGKQLNIFHKRDVIDLMHVMFMFFENEKDVKSLSMDNLVRGYMGASEENAHDALQDVKQCADLLCRSFRLIRGACEKTRFKNCLRNKKC